MSFREIFRTSDPVRADILAALLTSEGVVFRRLGGPGPAMGTLLHEYRFEVAPEDYLRAESLVASVEGGLSNDLRGDLESERRHSSRLRRVTPLLVRVWLFVSGGVLLMLPMLWLFGGAREIGLPSLALVSVRRFPTLGVLGGLALAFIPDRERRNRATILFLVSMGFVSLFGAFR